MEDAVIAVDPEQRVQWANQSMDRLVPQHTRLNAPVVETVRDPDFLRAVRGAIESHAVLTARATSILPARTFEVTAAPMPGGGAVAVLRDLTETERVEKTRRDFIANVSHELRTPLTSIQGYTETLLDSTTGNDAERDFLEIIRKNADPHGALDRRSVDPGESGIRRAAFRYPARPSGRTLCRRQCKASAKSPAPRRSTCTSRTLRPATVSADQRSHPSGFLQSHRQRS